MLRRNALALGLLFASGRVLGGPETPRTPAPPDTARAAEALDAPPAYGPRVWFGILLGDAVDGGVQVLEVVPNGPAARAGLLSGDLVIRANGEDVAGRDDLGRILAVRSPGDALELTLLRDGTTREARVLLGTPPPRGWALPRVAPPAPTASSFLGLEVGVVPDELRRHLGGPAEAGVLVMRLRAGGLAARALKVGDLLVRVGGKPIQREADLDAAVFAKRTGPLTLSGFRDKRPFDATIAVADPTAEGRSREDRARALEAAIRELESQLAELKRQRAALTTGP